MIIFNRYADKVILEVSGNLQDADLRGANLQDADLQGANLQNADLQNANLQSASLQWNSHDLIAEILRQAADDDVDKLKIAGFILVSRGKCWCGFSAMVDPLKDWALDTLAALVLDNNGAPAELVKRVTKLTNM